MLALRAAMSALAAVAVRASSSTCTGGHLIEGIDRSFLMGTGGGMTGNSLRLDHNSGFSVTKSCQEGSWDPSDITLLHLLGKTLSFAVDLSKVGCACNLALYLVHGPARDQSGKPSEGTCSWSPYYC